MPRGVHPNSLANLCLPWSSTFHVAPLGVRARRLKALSKSITPSETLIHTDSHSCENTSEIELVRERILKAEKMYDRERIPMRLEQLAGTIAKLRQIERRLTGESRSNRPAQVKQEPVKPIIRPKRPLDAS